MNEPAPDQSSETLAVPASSSREQSATAADLKGTADLQFSLETSEFLRRGGAAATTEFSSDGNADSLRTLAMPAPAPRVLPTVPGYDIVGELGRGAMGVVYKARQKKLKRVVALKMVLAGSHASPDKLARFHTEAMAVARLQHVNIVQIYEVGEHDGLPYFSLEYVDGAPLDKKINRQPQRAQEAARIVESIARAMHFAHQRQIVHRDLKPANVMITVDGVPKVTDFGLAKAVECDDTHTRSGTILGSPSYMAPEQARGDIHAVGPLSDQYGVGAILYELLTGRPPFQGASILDTLDQVQSREPVHPTQLAPSVPVDLETICLKALQKEPTKRYEDCGALADDVSRFLKGEPILARPVSNAERFLRWCQRNPRIAALSAASLLLLLVGLGVSTAFAYTFARQNKVIAEEKKTSDDLRTVAQNEATEAKKQRGFAEENAAEATKQTRIAEQNAREEQEQRLLADAAKKAADENAALASQQATVALQTIQTLVDKLQRALSDAPGMQQLKKDTLNLALTELDKVANVVDKSTSKEVTQLMIHLQLGGLFRQLGETDRAASRFAKALELSRERVRIKEGSDASRANLAKSLRDMGSITQEKGRDMEAVLTYYREALDVRQQILDAPAVPKPGENAANKFLTQNELSEDHIRIGTTIYRLGDPAAALPHFLRAREIRQKLTQTPEDHPDLKAFTAPQRQLLRGQLAQNLARSNLAVGEVSFRKGDSATAIQVYGDELELREKLLAAAPTNRNHRFELARTHGNLGDIYLHTDNLDDAEMQYQAALQHVQGLVEVDKEIADYQRDLGLAHYRLGNLALRRGETEQAAEQFARSLEVREALVARDATNDRRQMELMLALAHCKQHVRAAEMAATYRQKPEADNELLLDVARAYAQCAAAVSEPAEAAGYCEQAVEAITAALANGYKDAVYLEMEPDYEPLRSHPKFKELLAQLRDALAKRE